MMRKVAKSFLNGDTFWYCPSHCQNIQTGLCGRLSRYAFVLTLGHSYGEQVVFVPQKSWTRVDGGRGNTVISRSLQLNSGNAD